MTLSKIAKILGYPEATVKRFLFENFGIHVENKIGISSDG